MSNRDDQIIDLVIQWDTARQAGQDISVTKLCRDAPELVPDVEERISAMRATDWMAGASTNCLASDVLNDISTACLPEGMPLDQFAQNVVATELVPLSELDQLQQDRPIATATDLAVELLGRQLLTAYQLRVAADGNPHPLLLGNYEIIDELGEGGMGKVFKARHRKMKRTVAIKTLPRQSDETVARFHREVEAAARLVHPNVVTAFDADEYKGTHFLVMECVDGRDLRSVVKQDGPMSISAAIEVMLQVARGLEYAHSQSIVHRDIKPANLLIDTSGTVKILDMGLARIDVPAGDADSVDDLTHTGAVLGTVDFMAPEQATDSKSSDPRSDIYSLGCTLHFLLVGRPPYSGKSVMSRLIAHRESPTPRLDELRHDVPDAVISLFENMMAREPEDRYDSASELIEALEKIAHDLGVDQRETSSAILSGISQSALRETRTPAEHETARLGSPSSDTVPMRHGGAKREWHRGLLAGAIVVSLAVVTAVTVMEQRGPDDDDAKQASKSVESKSEQPKAQTKSLGLPSQPAIRNGDPSIDQVFRDLDKNSNGVLDRDELPAGREPSIAADTNNDNAIDREELIAYRSNRKHGQAGPKSLPGASSGEPKLVIPSDPSELLTHLDADKNGTISLKEEIPPPHLIHFKDFDLNDDGELSRAELVARQQEVRDVEISTDPSVDEILKQINAIAEEKDKSKPE